MRVKGPKGSPKSRSGMQPAVNTWIIGEGLPSLLPLLHLFRGHATPPHQLQIGCCATHTTMQPEEALHTAALIGFNFDIV